MSSWYRIEAKAGTPTIYIYDEIGLFGVTASDFARELKALGDLKGKALNVRINSPGGDVFSGNAIMVLLRDTGAHITVYIDGIAASMASAIAMVGDKVIIAEGAMMMIHNPASFAGGDSEELRSTATLLDSIKEGMVTAYSKKSGMSRAAIAKIMDEDTWFTAQEALDAGFADEIGEVVKVAAFDLSRYSRNPPTDSPEASKEVSMTKEEIAALVADGIKGALPTIVSGVADALKAAPKEAEPVAVKSAEDIRKDLKAEMAAYAAEVREVCALAGLPNLADGYIAAEKLLTEVRADLKAKKAEAANTRQTPRVNNHSGAALEGADDKDAEDISDLIPKARSSSEIWAQFNKPKALASRGARH